LAGDRTRALASGRRSSDSERVCSATGASLRYISIGEVDLRIAGGIALGGIPAVLVAAFIVKSLSLELLRWLVVGVVLYAALVMLKAAATGRRGLIAADVRR
jgi:uncharacterized membrane protein YfcA